MASRARSSWFPLAEGLIPAEAAGNAGLALNVAGGPRLEGWLASWCLWLWAGAGGAGPGQHLLTQFTWRFNRSCCRGVCSGHCAAVWPQVPAAGCCSSRGASRASSAVVSPVPQAVGSLAGICRLKAWCAGPGRRCIRCWGIEARSWPGRASSARWPCISAMSCWSAKRNRYGNGGSNWPRGCRPLPALAMERYWRRLVMGRAMAPLPDAITSSFRAAGLSHALAASGFHLSVLLGVVLTVHAPRTAADASSCSGCGCIGAVCAAGRANAIGAQGGVDGGHGAADSRIR